MLNFVNDFKHLKKAKNNPCHQLERCAIAVPLLCQGCVGDVPFSTQEILTQINLHCIYIVNILILIEIAMDIEWDELKAISNIEKHGVSFEEAMTALMDPMALTFFDEDIYDEPREITIAMSKMEKLLLVIHVEVSDNLVRIISARKATKKERGFYEKGI